MNLFAFYQNLLTDLLDQMVDQGLISADAPLSKASVDTPRDERHGDLALNAAMVLAKPSGKNPRELAEQIAQAVRSWPFVERVELAGPGFINMRLGAEAWAEMMTSILQNPETFGRSKTGSGASVNVEYVSANPTGPLTIGHARNAVLGDVIANLLEATGHKVIREFYLNDAGNQVDVLARSAYLRYREAFGETISIPEGCYPGAYLKQVGEALKQRDGAQWLNADEQAWLPVVRRFAVDEMVEGMREDLRRFGIEQQISSERALVDAGAVQTALTTLTEKGVLYRGVLEPPKGKKPDDWEPREQLLFRSTDFGDDVDRPLQKSDGSYTYFANDIAYHLDKFRRGGNAMVHILGEDHKGYIKRLTAAVAAITDGKCNYQAVVYAIVRIFKNGQEVRMSKRAGNFVTLSDVMDDIGADVLRFMMLTRRSEAVLDLDLEQVAEQSNDNPVFYVQYANARISSVLRKSSELLPQMSIADSDLSSSDVSLLTSEAELAVLRVLAQFPRMVEQAALAREPHRVVFYLTDLAAAFHGLWAAGNQDATLRFILENNQPLTPARMALIRAVSVTISAGLQLMGVEPRTEM